MDSIPYSHMRAHLAETLDRLEVREEPVFISRRGEPAAVLMSVTQYARLLDQADGPAARLAAWRARTTRDLQAAQDEPDPWADVRERTPPRPAPWADEVTPAKKR